MRRRWWAALFVAAALTSFAVTQATVRAAVGVVNPCTDASCPTTTVGPCYIGCEPALVPPPIRMHHRRYHWWVAS